MAPLLKIAGPQEENNKKMSINLLVKPDSEKSVILFINLGLLDLFFRPPSKPSDLNPGLPSKLPSKPPSYQPPSTHPPNHKENRSKPFQNKNQPVYPKSLDFFL